MTTLPTFNAGIYRHAEVFKRNQWQRGLNVMMYLLHTLEIIRGALRLYVYHVYYSPSQAAFVSTVEYVGHKPDIKQHYPP